jgi:hypothetical protein
VDVAKFAEFIAELVTPRVALADQAATGGVLPFRLRRQPAPSPLTVRDRVVPTHVHDRVIGQTVEVAQRAARMPPIGSAHTEPPRLSRGLSDNIGVIGLASEMENGRVSEGIRLGAVTGCVAHDERLRREAHLLNTMDAGAGGRGVGRRHFGDDLRPSNEWDADVGDRHARGRTTRVFDMIVMVYSRPPLGCVTVPFSYGWSN